MIRPIVLSFVCAGLCFPQSSAAASAWNIVGAVRQGHKIRVETPARKYSGTFVELSDAAISLQSDTGQVSVPQRRCDAYLLAIQIEPHSEHSDRSRNRRGDRYYNLRHIGDFAAK